MFAKVSTNTWHVKVGQIDFMVRRRPAPPWFKTRVYAWRLIARIDGVWLCTQWFDTKREAAEWIQEQTRAYA